MMRILLVQNIYNEIGLLPWKMAWADENGLESFTWDNCSTDGSYPWLRIHGYRAAQFYTNNIFSLQVQNRNVMDIIHRYEDVKPDWVVIAGADMFYYIPDPDISNKDIPPGPLSKRGIGLWEFIKKVDGQGYSLINCSRLFNFYYTGTERDDVDPRGEYFYYHEAHDFEICLIAKYHKNLWINGDQFTRTPGKMYPGNELITFHYWMRGDAKQRRTEHFLRRKRAWERGIDRECHGTHYQKMVENDQWIWDKGELKDIRELGEYKDERK